MFEYCMCVYVSAYVLTFVCLCMSVVQRRKRKTIFMCIYVVSNACVMHVSLITLVVCTLFLCTL